MTVLASDSVVVSVAVGLREADSTLTAGVGAEVAETMSVDAEEAVGVD